MAAAGGAAQTPRAPNPRVAHCAKGPERWGRCRSAPVGSAPVPPPSVPASSPRRALRAPGTRTSVRAGFRCPLGAQPDPPAALLLLPPTPAAPSQSRALRPLARPVSGCTVRDRPVLPDPAHPGPAPWPRRSSLEPTPPGPRSKDPAPPPARAHPVRELHRGRHTCVACSLCAPPPGLQQALPGQESGPAPTHHSAPRGPEELRRRRLGPSPPAPPPRRGPAPEAEPQPAGHAPRRGFLPARTAHRSPVLYLHGLGPGPDEPFRHQGG